MAEIFSSEEEAMAAAKAALSGLEEPLEAVPAVPDVNAPAAPPAVVPPAAAPVEEPAELQSVAEPIEPPVEESIPAAPMPEQASLDAAGFMDVLNIARAPETKPNPNVNNVDPVDPQTNTLRVQLPEGATIVPPEMTESAVSLMAQAFPSMNQVGMLLDINDRLAYAMSVMGNKQLRGDIKAQIADQVMRDGKITMEALPHDWYEARNMILPR